MAHVTLEQAQAATGSNYRAVLRVSHGCDGAATTSISVRLPRGFQAAKPEAKDGWSIATREGVVTWTAASTQAALPPNQRGEFAMTGDLPKAAGPLWFKLLQGCEKGSIDWADVPADGTDVAGLKSPAALLEVMSPSALAQAQMLPKVEGAWVRTAVAGQQGTAAFMKFTARETTQLVGVRTPVAGNAEVHEMKMEADVMTMRPVGNLDLPAGKRVELSPSGYHIMLQDLKQPLAAGSAVPLTLLFRNAKGIESKLELKVPVALRAPGGATAPTDGHKH